MPLLQPATREIWRAACFISACLTLERECGRAVHIYGKFGFTDPGGDDERAKIYVLYPPQEDAPC